ncbi:MAG: hypothetical protein AB1430_02055 [Pseudomonadota bacterium]
MKAAPTSSCSLTLRIVAAVIVATSAAAWHAGARSQTPATAQVRSSAEQGVTVKVTPYAWAPGEREWLFAVVLDTHSASLDDDLAKTAVLVIDGREVAPLRWRGAVPGGHHREGDLAFASPAARPESVELRLQRPGESALRVFRWDAASLK